MGTRYRSLEFKGFPEYRIGTDGSVWRFWAEEDRRKKKGWVRLKTPTMNKKYGYKQIMLHHRGYHKTYIIHALVLEAFVGPRPTGSEACHRNGDGSDNRLVNLRWDSPRNNQLDRKHQGTWICGSMVKNSLLTEKDVKEIRELHKSGMYTANALGVMYKVHPDTIRLAIKRKTWNHVQ